MNISFTNAIRSSIQIRKLNLFDSLDSVIINRISYNPTNLKIETDWVAVRDDAKKKRLEIPIVFNDELSKTLADEYAKERGVKIIHRNFSGLIIDLSNLDLS